MKSKYIDLRTEEQYLKLKEPARILKKGGVVLFPTETVYGLGADGLNEKAVEKIYTIKGRKSDNPLILHISDYKMLKTIAKEPTNVEKRLMDAFWPGPLTIILERQENVPNIVTAELETVGVRMPSGKIAHELIKYANVPLAAPSANISGRPSGTNIQDIIQELDGKVDYIIDGGISEIGLESTVVRVINEVPHILRPGKITPEEIEKVIGKVEINKNILSQVEDIKKVMSPGMKYRHYAPNSKCILVYSAENKKLISKINEISQKYINSVIVCTSENADKYTVKNKIVIGSQKNLEEISKNIFTTLRKVDKFSPDIVIIEGVTKKGLGLAIMNRLLRACEYNLIEV